MRFADPADPADGAHSANCADLVRAAAQRTPAGPALIGAWGTRSWAQLDAAIDAGVPVFRAGVPAPGADSPDARPADRVVLALPTGPELAAALFAVFRAGLVAVPVDPRRTDIAWVVRRVGATHVVTDAVPDASAQITAQITTGAQVAAWWGSDTPARARTRAAYDDVRGGAQSGGEDLALLARAARQGPPVMLPHRALIAAARAISGAEPVAMGPADRVLQVLPLFHVVGLVTAFLPAALAGAAVVVPDPNGSTTPAEAALAAVRTHRVSVLPAEPTLYRQLDRIDGFERALATVRLMTSGSSPLDPVDFATIRTATGQAVREGYGISEAASAVTSTLMSPSAKAGSVGRAYPGVEVRILGDSPSVATDSAPSASAAAATIAETSTEAGTESGDDAGAGTAAAAPTGGDETGLGAVIPAVESAVPATGETREGRSGAVFDELTDLAELSAPGGDVGPIAIRGDTLFTGYWPDGRSGPDADGWFVTGDIGYFDDAGELHLVDRAEEAVTVAGFTVYPREVEDALVRHPLVADAAVVGMPGRGGETVVAALVAKAGTRPTSSDVGEFVASLLPPFKRPTDYRLVDVLPRTEVGRLDRATVRRDFAASRGIDLLPPVRLRPADDPDRAVGPGVGPVADRDQGPERAAGLNRLGRRLPAADSGRGRSARDTDEDLF